MRASRAEGSVDVRTLADEDLVPLMARGDARAFEAIYERHSGAAYSLALEAERRAPKDPILAKLWPSLSMTISIETSPPGAEVYRKEYNATDSKWEYAGRSPLKNIRIPRVNLQWKIVKPGFATADRSDVIIFPSAASAPRLLSVNLDTAAKAPVGMVRVSVMADHLQS